MTGTATTLKTKATTNVGSAQQQLLSLIDQTGVASATELMALFEQLEPASEAFMLGQWHGGRFEGGKEPNPIRWYGKRFTSRDHVEPMLCTKPDGTIYAWDTWGQAQMREMVFDGVVQAALIYDSKPMMDYFRKISDDTVLGLGDIKGRPVDFFFWLRRDPEGKTKA